MKLFRVFALLVTAAAVLNAQQKDEQLMRKAEQLSKDLLIIDTHIDLPYQLNKGEYDVAAESKGHFDYPKAVRGGLNAAFMSIYIPPELEFNGAKAHADTLIQIVESLPHKYPGKFKTVYSTDDLLNEASAEKVLLPMGMENGSPIEGNINNLKYFYEKGIRYITLCHVKNNHICDSSGEPDKKWNGLSPFGEDVVKEMNRLGIMVDISHVSDSAFYDVLKLSKVPVIASHSGCRHFTPGFERNMDDNMIKALAANGGVIQIYFGSTMLIESSRQQYDTRSAKRDEFSKQYADLSRAEKSEKFNQLYPVNRGTVKDVVDHIDRVVKLAGIDHVGLGSDYDGLGNLPEGMEDASSYPNLIYALLEAGYSDEDIKKICSGNILRVWKKAEEYARNSGSK